MCVVVSFAVPVHKTHTMLQPTGIDNNSSTARRAVEVFSPLVLHTLSIHTGLGELVPVQVYRSTGPRTQYLRRCPWMSTRVPIHGDTYTCIRTLPCTVWYTLPATTYIAIVISARVVAYRYATYGIPTYRVCTAIPVIKIPVHLYRYIKISS